MSDLPRVHVPRGRARALKTAGLAVPDEIGVLDHDLDDTVATAAVSAKGLRVVSSGGCCASA